MSPTAIIPRISMRLQRMMAASGVRLIARSGIADGYWRPWRGSFFDDAQARGLHILPVHYYSPIPDTRDLSDDKSPLYAQHINYNAPQALTTVRRYAQEYAQTFEAWRERRGGDRSRYTPDNSAYHPGEAEVLYATVRSTRPRRIIEIGCGITTLIIAEALADARLDDPAYEWQYTCVEPFRPEYLRDPPAQVSEFLDEPVQKLSPDRVAQLEAGDILFIDSTHVVRAQSDVLHEIMALLPVLRPGVMVHVHDIFLPYDYPSQWMHESRFFWGEQYMLYAYLLGNPGIEVVLPLHMLSRQHHDEMATLFPGIDGAKMPPSAMWLRTK